MITFLYSLLMLGFVGLILSVVIDFAKAVTAGRQQLGTADFTDRYKAEQSKTLDFLTQFDADAIAGTKVKLDWFSKYFVLVCIAAPLFAIGSLVAIFF